MPGALTTLNIKDAGGTNRAVKAWDESGVGSGPFTFMHGLLDGVNSVDAVGEVQTTPSANTILARLKAIADAINNNVVSDALPFRSLSVTSPAAIKAAAGRVYWLHVMNMSASVRYLHLYNVAAAGVTLGTTTPVLTFPVPTLGNTNGMGFTMHFPNGINFDTAIALAAATTASGSTAASANEVVCNLGYS